jgi:ureidoglycolate hydrolase
MSAREVSLRLVCLASVDDGRFAPFGANFATTPVPNRVPVPLRFDGEATDGESTITVIRVPAAASVGSIQRVERHPLSVQAFIPLGGQPLVVLVAPAGAPPAHPDQLTAFRIPAGHGVAYRTGIWHAGLMGADDDTFAATFVRRMEDASDTEFALLPFIARIAESK